MSSTRRFHAGAALLLLAFPLACVSAPQGDRDPNALGLAQSRIFVSAKELQSAGIGTTLDALRRVRPELFLRRSASWFSDPYRGYAVIYLDGQFQGTLDLLNTIPVNAILSVQYMSGAEGHAHFGKYFPGGVIEVNTRP